MLTRISFTNFVLFDHVELELSEGFTVLSGETGAGKSLFIDGINLGLGSRVSENPVREGAGQTTLSLVFATPLSQELVQFCEEFGLELGDEIHLRRVIQKSGQSKAFVNDQAITLTTLKSLGELLLDSVGQFSAGSLLNTTTHLSYLDRYGQLEIETENTARTYTKWQLSQKDMQTLLDDLERLKRDAEFNAHALKELDEIKPTQGEETSLVEIRSQLMQSQKSQDAIASALQKLGGDKEVDALIFSAQRDLQRIADENTTQLNTLIDACDKLGSDARDLLEHLKDLYQSMTAGGSSLEEVDDRLHLLRGLARKYQTHGDGLYDYWQKLKEEVTDSTKREESLRAKQKEAKLAFAAYKEAAEVLSEKREKAARKLTQAVTKLLPDLKLGKAQFEAEIEKLTPEEGTKTGINKMHMRVSMNPGTALAPLHKVASGGELSRFLLILSSLCHFDTKTILFDEIDTGVGGAVASAMGLHLKKMSETQQVISLTHAPQIAALADAHFHAEKDQGKDTLSKITLLDDKGHHEEIARMLSGSTITDAARQAAKSLIEAHQDAA